MRRSYWAIQTRSKRQRGFIDPGLIGIYWFKEGRSYAPPPFAACTTALFKSRRQAREYLKLVKIPYGHPTAKVVRVEIVEAK